MKCPNCGFENAEGAAECGRCQVIFAKLAKKAASRERPSPAAAAASAGAPRRPLPELVKSWGAPAERLLDAALAPVRPLAARVPDKYRLPLIVIGTSLTVIAAWLLAATLLSFREPRPDYYIKPSLQELNSRPAAAPAPARKKQKEEKREWGLPADKRVPPPPPPRPPELRRPEGN